METIRLKKLAGLLKEDATTDDFTGVLNMTRDLEQGYRDKLDKLQQTLKKNFVGKTIQNIIDGFDKAGETVRYAVGTEEKVASIRNVSVSLRSNATIAIKVDLVCQGGAYEFILPTQNTDGMIS